MHYLFVAMLLLIILKFPINIWRLGDGKWDFKLQDENDDYNNRARGMAGTGKATVRVGSTRL